MIFLELITTHADRTNIFVPIVAVAPVGVLRFPFQLVIFAVSAEVEFLGCEKTRGEKPIGVESFRIFPLFRIYFRNNLCEQLDPHEHCS